jgi:hypothetical protein
MIIRLITSISLLISLFEYTAFGAAEGKKEEHIEDPLISLQPLPRDLPPHESRRFIIAFNTSPHHGLQLASTLGLLNHDLSTDTDSLFDHKREGTLDDSCLSASKLQELYKARAKTTKQLVSKEFAAIHSSGPRAARLLLHPSISPYISKRLLGEFLGNCNPLSEATCVAYCRLSMRIVSDQAIETMRPAEALNLSLRSLLGRFRLPGEAQQIGRIIEAFANAFTEAQPRAFLGGADSAHILAFSIIQLNTDLHNSSIKKDLKMTKKQYLSNCRGTDAGSDFPTEILSEIYDSILAVEIKLGEDDEGEFTKNIHEIGRLIKKRGWINKQKNNAMAKLGRKFSLAYNERWFVLTDEALYYFKSPLDQQLRYRVAIEDIVVAGKIEEHTPQSSTHKKTSLGGGDDTLLTLRINPTVEDDGSTGGASEARQELILRFSSPEDCHQWYIAICEAIAAAKF